jgi:hypothetical protein
LPPKEFSIIDEKPQNTNYKHPIFLQEPFHTTHLVADQDSIDKLNGENWLSTSLLDFLIKQGIPLWKTDDFLVPTTTVEDLLDYYNEKAESMEEKDIAFVLKKRNSL